ncbi:ABC transporter substrate-binding protein [Phytoactinopolyspora halotolerans]|uniref:Sugar ABC transporter substrate-binding protein n=1 Tax=Phytoactinopolyspora halotolerans TaxID=1981512 RepID=A0A6L9S2Z8_9ACTN|nr:sugar ABC transporter substrate-binding protein [Phytoactinopolyspora halotolerans]NED99432.1 sugar ABC transporter substrate-binding protein [Phytoactinopolyspora halotolerans]
MQSTVRHRALALGLVALLAAATGCGSDDPAEEASGSDQGPGDAPTDPVTITFSSWVGNEDGMQRLYQRFQEEHPNITVEFQDVPAEQARQKLTTQIAGGNPPDVAYVDASDVITFAGRQALVNLDDYIAGSESIEADDYVEAFEDFVTYDGSLYGLPFDGESTGLFYRTDLFEEAGIEEPPATWDEFIQTVQALTMPDEQQYGFQIFAPEAAYYWYPWLWQAGGELLSEDEQSVEFNSDAGKEAAEFYASLTDVSAPDHLNSNSYDGRVAFANGQVAMYMAGAWFAGVLDDEFPDIAGKWDTAPLPEGSAGCATTVAGDALVIFGASEHVDAAWTWIEFLGRPENVAEWTYKTEGTLLPPYQSLLDSPELAEEKPVLAGFAEAMTCGQGNIIANPDWPQAEEILTEQLGRAIYGEMSGAEAVDAAAAEAASILGQ